MNDEAKRIIKIEILVVGLTLLFTIFVHFNSTTKVMDKTCEQLNSEKNIDCE